MLVLSTASLQNATFAFSDTRLWRNICHLNFTAKITFSNKTYKFALMLIHSTFMISVMPAEANCFPGLCDTQSVSAARSRWHWQCYLCCIVVTELCWHRLALFLWSVQSGSTALYVTADGTIFILACCHKTSNAGVVTRAIITVEFLHVHGNIAGTFLLYITDARKNLWHEIPSNIFFMFKYVT